MNWLIVLLVLAVLVYLVFQIMIWQSRKKWSAADQKFFHEQWNKITANPDHRHRLMEADKLLDHFLAKRGYQGSLGEKLKAHGGNFKDLNGLWQAHKLRNRLAHELDVKLSAGETERALNSFKKALGDLGLH